MMTPKTSRNPDSAAETGNRARETGDLVARDLVCHDKDLIASASSELQLIWHAPSRSDVDEGGHSHRPHSRCPGLDKECK